MEYSWSYNNGQPNSGGSGQGSYVNTGHIQQDNSSAIGDTAGFGYPASQVGSDPEAMDFDEPRSNHSFGHSTNHPGVDEPNANMDHAGIDQMALDFDELVDSQPDFDIGGPFDHPGVSQHNDNMNQAGIDQMSLDLDEIDSQPDFDIGGPFDHPGVSQPNDNMNQAGIDQIGLDLAEPDNNHPGFGHPNNHQGVNEPNVSMPQVNVDQMPLEVNINENLPQAAAISPSSTSYAHAGKTITQMVNERTNGEYQGYFTSRQHRKEIEEQYMQQQAARMLATISPASLADLPGEDEAKLLEWRKKITEAIRDCTNVVNKDRIHETKNEKGEVIKRVIIENTHVRRVRALSLFVTELIADKILETAEEAHQCNTGIAPWVEKSSWVLEKYPTFEARMQAVLDALRRNKSVAHSFLQVDPALRFVAAPKAEIKGKDENMTCNGNRGELIREGQKVKKAEGKKVGGKKAKGEADKGKKGEGKKAEGEKAKGKNAEGN